MDNNKTKEYNTKNIDKIQRAICNIIYLTKHYYYYYYYDNI